MVFVREVRSSLIPSEQPHECSILPLNNVDQRFGFFGRNIFIYERSSHALRGEVDVHSDLASSIAKLLVPYYFAAGRFCRSSKDPGKMDILCNNRGALLVDATADDADVQDARSGRLDCEQFVHFPNEATSIEDMPLLTVQVTSFRCGGFAIGILVHHAMADATSAMNLLLNLSSISRTGEVLLWPNCERLKPRSPPRPTHPHSELAPHPDLAKSRYCISLATIRTQQSGHKKPRQIIRFTPSSLETLKASILSDQQLIKSCSTFEALAAFVWRARAATLTPVSSSKKKLSRLRFFLDVRSIVQPAMGASFCGNAIYCVNAEAEEAELRSKPLCFAVSRIQEARKQMTDEYVRSGLDFLELNRNHWYADNCDVAVNAWPRLMVATMELDLGWGKPARTEFPLDPGSSTIVFFPVAKGGGIDVSLCLDESSDEDDRLRELLYSECF